MIQRFLRVARRHLLRNRIYTGLNILGLSVGLACFAIIGIWVRQQFSYDRMHANARHIFQVNAVVSDETGIYRQAITPAPLAAALANDLPEVDLTLRLDVNGAVVKYGTQQFVEEGILGADSSFFDFFDFKLLKGNPATALSEPYSVIISKQLAKKYFGDRDPINESLRIFQYDPDGNGAEYKITGVIEDCPLNSHFSYSMLISFKTIEVAEPESLTDAGWNNNEYYTYVRLNPSVSASSLDSKLPGFLEKYAANKMNDQKVSYRYYLTPLSDIHFNTDVRYGIQPGTSLDYVMIFSAIGLVVLVLACVNYVCLSTAYSSYQFTEVGIRQVLGASRRLIILQCLVESWLVSVSAMILSLVWVELSKPMFEKIFGFELAGLYSFSNQLTLFGVASLAGILSGVYPSLILSSFRTIKILKGQFDRGTSGAVLRKVLVVLQYCVTVVLITGIMSVHRQLNYLANKEVGFRKDNLFLLASNGSPEVIPGYPGFYNELASHSNILAIARSNTGIGGGGLDKSAGVAESAEGNRIHVMISTIGADHDYLSTYGMSLAAGRNFIPGNKSDSAGAYIINESAAYAWGYRNIKDAVGKFFSLGGRDGFVIGVVHDFHYSNLREKIGPVAIYLLNGYFSRITVRVDGDAQEANALITATWKKHFPGSVADISFLKDRLRQSYRSEDRFAKIFLIFSIISLIIASLGLFALVSYHVERRSREIGIRKIVGGTAREISFMLSREFLLLILVACAIAIPLSWYILDTWLQHFAYHVDLPAGTFLAGAAANIVIAMITVGLKTVRSALRNPVDSLRSE